MKLKEVFTIQNLIIVSVLACFVVTNSYRKSFAERLKENYREPTKPHLAPLDSVMRQHKDDSIKPDLFK